MRFYLSFFFLFSFACLLQNCNEKTGNEKEGSDFEEPVLAEFDEQKLKLGQISALFPAFENEEDSIRFLSQYVEKWLKDLSYLEKAKKELTTSPEIESLVEDYKNSLLLNAYEEKIIATSLDTQVTEKEILDYYNQNKGEYKLDETILRLLYVKIPKSAYDSKVFSPLWNKPDGQNFNELQKYCQNNAEFFILQSDKWYKWNDINDLLPTKFISQSSIFTGMQREFADFKYHYLIKIKEVVRPNEQPPISYFSMKAEKSILHDRSKQLIEKEKTLQYENMLNQKRARQHIK
ncbi:MAG: hypothetical protein IPM48_03330 [Saprospiraceae bacterium]|nr:hypothetical protein [Saprospiraceae bacterium]